VALVPRRSRRPAPRREIAVKKMPTQQATRPGGGEEARAAKRGLRRLYEGSRVVTWVGPRSSLGATRGRCLNRSAEPVMKDIHNQRGRAGRPSRRLARSPSEPRRKADLRLGVVQWLFERARCHETLRDGAVRTRRDVQNEGVNHEDAKMTDPAREVKSRPAGARAARSAHSPNDIISNGARSATIG